MEKREPLQRTRRKKYDSNKVINMDLELAKLYNTPGQKIASAAQAEDLEKAASLELFAKLAANNGIDISTLSNDQISTLWSDTFGTPLVSKEAGAMPPQFMQHMKGKEEGKEHEGKDKKHEGKKEEKHEEKEKEEHEKKAAAEFAALQTERSKLAEADRAGRVMAHAMVQELNSINDAIAKEATAKTAAPVVETTATSTKIAEYVAQKGRELSKVAAPAAAPAQGLRKEASSIERLAVDRALEIGAAAGFSTEEVGQKLAAYLTPGIAESTKMASAVDVKQAVELRALEFLEGAGYSVTWN